MEHSDQPVPTYFFDGELRLMGQQERAEEIIAETPPQLGRSERTREQVLHDQALIKRFGSRRLAQAAIDRSFKMQQSYTIERDDQS